MSEKDENIEADGGARSDCPRCGAPMQTDAPGELCPRCLMSLPLEGDTMLEGEALSGVPEVAEVQKHFPHLEVLECLGRGGMGVVFKARQKSLNRMVALKLLTPERAEESGFAERFEKEAHALAALSHPNIVTIHDFGEAGGFFFLLMEFVDGVNLRQAMNAGRFTPEEALAIVPPVCEALQYAHEHGIMHRDIKPENLLLDKAGRVKIADFGVAKMVGATVAEASAEGAGAASAETMVGGTPRYMAPEQLDGPGQADHRVDIYAMGVVLYELLTGETPVQGKITPPSKRVEVDVRIDEIVLRALEEEPEMRYATAAEFRTRVEAVATGAAVGGERSPEARFSRTAICGAGLAGCFFVLAAIAVGWVNLHAERSGSLPVTPAGALRINLLLWFLGGLGLAAPIGATVLGWVAVAQIRHSRGQLYGLGLAVFDGLLFPLLLLNAVVASAMIVAPRALGAGISMEWGRFYFLGLAIGIVVLDVFLVRRVWWGLVGRAKRSKARMGLGGLGLILAGLSGLFGIMTFMTWADGAEWLGAVIVLCAVGGIVLGMMSRHGAAGRAAMVVGGVNLLIASVIAIWGTSGREDVKIVDRHLEQLEVAVKMMEAEAEDAEKVAHWSRAFEEHRDALVAAGYFDEKVFNIVAPIDSPEYKELIEAVMEKAEGAPVCSWSPGDFGTQVTVWATREEMAEWEVLLSRWEWMDSNPLRVISGHSADALSLGTEAGEARGAAFEEAVELKVNIRGFRHGSDGLRLRDARRFDLESPFPPEGTKEMREKRLEESGVNVAVIYVDPEQWNLELREVVFAELAPEDWEEMDGETFKARALEFPWKADLPEAGEWEVLELPKGRKAPLTFAFRTSEGVAGLLQVAKYHLEAFGAMGLTFRWKRLGEKIDFSKRRRFVGKAGMEEKSNWGVMEGPSPINPDGWGVIAHLTLGGTARPILPGEEESVLLKLLTGDEDAIVIEVRDEVRGSTMTFDLVRDRPAEMTLNGRGYRLVYPTTRVAAGDEETTPYAMVIVTPAGEPGEGTTGGGGFEPVMKVTLAASDQREGAMLDLDSGALVDAPRPIPVLDGDGDARVAEMAFFREEGVDVMSAYLPGSVEIKGLFGTDLAMLPVEEKEWEGMPAEKVAELIAPYEGGDLVPMNTNGFLPATYVFKTREGGSGLLQIVGFPAEPPGVEIRFKLVEGLKGPGGVEAPPGQPIVLTVGRDLGGRVSADGYSYSLDGELNPRANLREQLRRRVEANPELRLVVRAGVEVAMERVTSVLEIAKEAGVKHVSLATTPDEKSTEPESKQSNPR